jgi:TIR domain-containing protein
MVWGEKDWEAKLQKAIETSDAFVLVCTKESCCSPNLMKEILWAEKVSLIMPLKLDGEPLHPHPLVFRANAHDFNSRHPNYDAVKRELLRGVKEFQDKIDQAKNAVPETGAVGATEHE